MRRLMCCGVLLSGLGLLAVPGVRAQVASPDAAGVGSEAAGVPAPVVQSRPKGPLGAISVGYLYLGAQGPSTDWTWHLHGFYGIPQVNLKPWFALIGDFTSSYNTGATAHENVHAYLGGPLFTARSSKFFSPFAFVTAGKVRDSNAGTITSSPALAPGIGATFKVNKHLALLLVPGEYVRVYPASGPALNNFTSRFGFVIPISR